MPSKTSDPLVSDDPLAPILVADHSIALGEPVQHRLERVVVRRVGVAPLAGRLLDRVTLGIGKAG